MDDRERKIIYPTIYVNISAINIFGNRFKTWKDWFWYDEISHISMDIFRFFFISYTSLCNSAFYIYQFIYLHRSAESNDSCNVNKWIFGRLSKQSMNTWWYQHNLVDDFNICCETITNNCGIEFNSRWALLLSCYCRICLYLYVFLMGFLCWSQQWTIFAIRDNNLQIIFVTFCYCWRSFKIDRTSDCLCSCSNEALSIVWHIGMEFIQ